MFVSPVIVQLVAGERTIQLPTVTPFSFAVTVNESAGPLLPLKVPPLTLIVVDALPAATVIVGAAGAFGCHCE